MWTNEQPSMVVRKYKVNTTTKSCKCLQLTILVISVIFVMHNYFEFVVIHGDYDDHWITKITRITENTIARSCK